MDIQWEQLATELQAQLDSVKREISQYPGPITGCDAQFNYLLEQRYGLTGELTRLKKAMAAAESPEEFVLASSYLNLNDKEKI